MLSVAAVHLRSTRFGFGAVAVSTVGAAGGVVRPPARAVAQLDAADARRAERLTRAREDQVPVEPDVDVARRAVEEHVGLELAPRAQRRARRTRRFRYSRRRRSRAVRWTPSGSAGA